MMTTLVYAKQNTHSLQFLRQLKVLAPEFQVYPVHQAEGLSNYLKTNIPDVIFWMVDAASFDDPAFLVLENLPVELVLLATNEKDFLQYCELGTGSLMLLPLKQERFMAVMERLKRRRLRAETQHQSEALLQSVKVSTQRMPNIPIPTLQGFEFIPVSDIQYVQADGSYSHIFLNNGKKLTVSRSLKQLELLLDSSLFIRTHQSYLVQYAYIRSLVKGRSPYLLLNSGKPVEISRSYKKAVFEFLLAGAYGAVE